MNTHHFYIKLPYQKPMLRQIEWWVQNGSITKNRALPATTLFFWKLCFSLRTSYNESIWCSNNLNAHVHTFCKRRSFIWHCFFLVSVLKLVSEKLLKFLQNTCGGVYFVVNLNLFNISSSNTENEIILVKINKNKLDKLVFKLTY